MLMTLLMLFFGAIGLGICALVVVDRASKEDTVFVGTQARSMVIVGIAVIFMGVVGQQLVASGPPSRETFNIVVSTLAYLLGSLGLAVTLGCAVFTVRYLREVIIMRRLGGKSTYSRNKRIDVATKACMYPMLTLCIGATTVLNAHSLAG